MGALYLGSGKVSAWAVGGGREGLWGGTISGVDTRKINVLCRIDVPRARFHGFVFWASCDKSSAVRS